VPFQLFLFWQHWAVLFVAFLEGIGILLLSRIAKCERMALRHVLFGLGRSKRTELNLEWLIKVEGELVAVFDKPLFHLRVHVPVSLFQFCLTCLLNGNLFIKLFLKECIVELHGLQSLVEIVPSSFELSR